jgi:hypothetical protein
MLLPYRAPVAGGAAWERGTEPPSSFIRTAGVGKKGYFTGYDHGGLLTEAAVQLRRLTY